MTTQGSLDMRGPAAPPRSNGELVFAEPWESRAFAVAVTLHDAGAFSWDDFRDHLIARIAGWQRDHPPGEGWNYYRCWLQALETVVVDRGMVSTVDIADRVELLAARPARDGREQHRHGH